MKILSVLTASLLSFLPTVAGAVTYDNDGAALLGEQTNPTESSNVAAALLGGGFDLSCLGLTALILVTVYILHELWHPQRLHDEMSDVEQTTGSIRFYIGGTLVWILIGIMAEKWCIILPLVIILAIGLLYYTYILSSTTDSDS